MNWLVPHVSLWKKKKSLLLLNVTRLLLLCSKSWIIHQLDQYPLSMRFSMCVGCVIPCVTGRCVASDETVRKQKQHRSQSVAEGNLNAEIRLSNFLAHMLYFWIVWFRSGLAWKSAGGEKASASDQMSDGGQKSQTGRGVRVVANILSVKSKWKLHPVPDTLLSSPDHTRTTSCIYLEEIDPQLGSHKMWSEIDLEQMFCVFEARHNNWRQSMYVLVWGSMSHCVHSSSDPLTRLGKFRLHFWQVLNLHPLHFLTIRMKQTLRSECEALETPVGVSSVLRLIAGSHFVASWDVWLPRTMTCLPSLCDKGANLVPTGYLLSDHQSAPSRTVDAPLAACQEKQNSCSRVLIWLPSSFITHH